MTTRVRRPGLVGEPRLLAIAGALLAIRLLASGSAAASAPSSPAASAPICRVGNGPSPIVAAACLASELAPAWASSKGRPGQPY